MAGMKERQHEEDSDSRRTLVLPEARQGHGAGHSPRRQGRQPALRNAPRRVQERQVCRPEHRPRRPPAQPAVRGGARGRPVQLLGRQGEVDRLQREDVES